MYSFSRGWPLQQAPSALTENMGNKPLQGCYCFLQQCLTHLTARANLALIHFNYILAKPRFQRPPPSFTFLLQLFSCTPHMIKHYTFLNTLTGPGLHSWNKSLQKLWGLHWESLGPAMQQKNDNWVRRLKMYRWEIPVQSSSLLLCQTQKREQSKHGNLTMAIRGWGWEDISCYIVEWYLRSCSPERYVALNMKVTCFWPYSLISLNKKKIQIFQ